MTNNKQPTAVEIQKFIDKVNEKIDRELAWCGGDRNKSSEMGNWRKAYSDVRRWMQDLSKEFQQAKDMERAQQEKLLASWAKSREQTRETAMHIGFAKGFMSGLECSEDYYEELNRTQLDEDEFTRNYITDRFEETQGGEQ